MVKGEGDVFGGSTLFLDDPIDFSENKLFQMKVWSPRVGARVLLKVENALNPGVFFEVEGTSTVASTWETLEFDFNSINAGLEYSKITLIWDLGVVGDGSANFTFYFDDIELVMGGMEVQQIDLPITFEDGTLDYGLTDFAGNTSSIVIDPEDAGNTVVQVVRGAGSAPFAGTTVGQPLGLENPIPFDFDNTGMSVRVWSPEAGIPVRLKVEQVGAPGIFVETQAATNVAGTWETLEFDFSAAVGGGLNLDLDYDLVTIFFNFGADPGATPEQTYFFDDIEFAPGVGGFIPVALPIDFDTPDVTFGIFDFGGNESSVISDPEDAGNNVVQSIRTAGAAPFAGTTVPTGGLTDRIPFAEGETSMSLRVWSPEVGVPVRMKLEATGSPGLVAEKEIPTTTSGEWETIVFDFSVDALVPVDINANYNIVSLFFNFDADPATTPEQIYLWDDIAFGDGVVTPTNDACTGAISLECGASVSGNTSDATADGSLEFCGTSLTTAPGVWYSIVGDGDDITASLCGSGFDTKIGIFSGDCGALVCEAGNDDSCEFQSEVTFASADGVIYYIYVTGFSTASGDFDLSISCASTVVDCEGILGGPALPGTPCDDENPATEGETFQEDCSCSGGIIPPSNDLCVNAESVECGSTVSGSTSLASADADLPFCDTGLNTAPGVWYSIVGDGSDITASLCNEATSFDTKIGVFSGSCEALVCEAGNDDSCGLQSEVTFASADGLIYYIYVTGFSTASGDFDLSVSCASTVVDCEGVLGGSAIPGTPCDDENPATVGETFQEDCSCSGGIVVVGNDECDSSIDLVCGGSVDGTTVDATALSGLNDECNGFTSASAEDVWYSFEADGSSSYTVTVDTNAATSSSLMDAVIFVYSGACGDLTEIGCADNNFSSDFTGETFTLDAPEAGTYYVRVFNWNPGGEVFTISLDCESGCVDPYPAVDEASLGSTVLPNGSLRFEWDPIPGQIGCQINIVVGTGPQQVTKTVLGATASSFTAPVDQLVPFTTYNFRVRCGCSQSPRIIGPYTDYGQAFYFPSAITEEMGIGYSDTPLSQVDDDDQWSNTSLNADVVGDLFAMKTSESWVRVAPNPAQDNVNLSYNSLSEGQGFIRVFDAQGKLTFERVITFNEGLNYVNLNMNELENGIYIVEVLKGDSRESVRLLMQ
jgi:hypothetical protein